MVTWARRDPSVMLVWEDECWFSRFAQPRVAAWSRVGHSSHLVERMMLPRSPDKALACFGALCETTRQVYLSWCWQRPNADETIVFLKLLCSAAQALRKRTLVVIWDNASWHLARKVRRWIRRYNHEAKRLGSLRLLIYALPKRSPWLNPIEAHWMHAKRRVFEPSAHDLTAYELRRRVFAALNTRPFPWLPQYHP